MYIPKRFVFDDAECIIPFIKAHSFASIVTVKNNQPTANHLPFVIEERNDDLILGSHFSRSNPQWKDFSFHPVLVIFSGPHGYVDPRLYESKLSVPTWNYVAVHAYGTPHLVDDTEAAYQLLEKTIQTYNVEYLDQWQGLPLEYKEKMVKGIMAFEIKVTSLEAKKKLSQNKTASEKQRIAEAFSQSAYSHERELSQIMSKEIHKPVRE